MHRMVLGVLFSFLAGCTYDTAVSAPDSPVEADGTYLASVGQTAPLDASTIRRAGGDDDDSLACGAATFISSDPSIVSIGQVAGARALFHAVAVGTAAITVTCDDDAPATLTIAVKP